MNSMEPELYEINEEYFVNAGQSQASSWATPSWGLFTFVLFFATILIFVLALNRERLFLILISTYVTAAVIYLVEPLENFFFKSQFHFLAKILFFIIFLLLVILLFSHIYLIRNAKFFEKATQIVWFSVLEAGLLFSLFFLIFPAEIQAHFSFFIRSVFASSFARSVWTILPILSLIFLKKH